MTPVNLGLLVEVEIHHYHHKTLVIDSKKSYKACCLVKAFI